jgi:homoserine O-succinyltransferase/O-acetyltransferase
MALVDTRGSPAEPGPSAWRREPRLAAHARPLRIGIVNIMPRVESYERHLLAPLERAPWLVEPVWIRLRSHVYSSSDHDHIARFYRTYEQACREAPLDGLILTGAPVEELPFEDVTYWPELREILEHARAHVPTTLGLCWGGLALAKLLGIEKHRFATKLFGVFENRSLEPGRGVLGSGDDRFWCAQSRHSGVSDAALEAAARDGVVRLLSHAPETGYTVFETPDHRFVMHLGHPEYEPARLVEEWERDTKLSRADVEAPKNLDLRAPANVWRAHRTTLFLDWLEIAAEGAGPR